MRLGRPGARVLAAMLAGLALSGCLDTGPEENAAATEPAREVSTAEAGVDVDAALTEVFQNLSELVVPMRAPEPEVTLLDTAALDLLLTRLLAEPAAVESIARDQRLFRALGLVPEGFDLDEITHEFLLGGVAGLYVPEDGQLYVRIFGRYSTLEETTAAHEFFHYLQDRDYDLEAMSAAAEGDRDREAALSALVEGDAYLIQQQYIEQYISPTRLLGLSLASVLVTAPEDSPLVMQRESQFVYVQGARFVQEVLDYGVDRSELYAAPPLTTEQVLHPDKYFAREGGRAVALAPSADTFSNGWTFSDETRLGELFLRNWLESLGSGLLVASAGAAGWGGDAAYVLLRDDHAVGLIARVEWDSPADRTEFLEAAAEALDGDRDFQRTTCDGCTSAWTGSRGYIAVQSAGGHEGSPTFIAVTHSPSDLERLIAVAAAGP